MKKIFYCLGILLSIQSCSSTRFLLDGEKFYMGAELKVRDNENALELKELVIGLNKVVEPKPNEKLLGMRPSVWIYGATGKPKGKGLRYILKKNLGKPPVLYQPSIPEKTIRLLENRLFNLGYFNRKVSFEIEEKNSEVFLNYSIELNKPFKIKEISYPEDSSNIVSEIKSIRTNSLLKTGEIYNLEILKAERERINRNLKNKGNYFFSSDFMAFEIDSALNTNQLNVAITLKETSHKSNLDIYQIGNVNVYPNYKIDNDSQINSSKETFINGISYKDPDGKFRYQIFEPLIFLRSGETYQIDNHNLTLKRLSELNAFRFMNIRFQKSDSLKNTIDAKILLTPESTQSLLFDVEVTSKSNNFAGPEMSIDYKNRNRWHGAEVLGIRLSGGFETQVNGKNKAVNSYALGLDLTATFPRLISPIPFKISPTTDIPKTKIHLGNRFLNRAGFYRVNKTNIGLGYAWHTNKKQFHELNPININYIFLSNTTSEFDRLLDENTALQQSFEDQFILGGTYAYTLSNQVNRIDQDHFYFSASMDASGNLAQVLSKVINGKEESRNEILGLPYSQYIRTDFDLRYFWSFGENRTLATRMLIGAGFAYGNSQQLPYFKQFFIGGSNSVRAFRPRGIGPGSYHSTSDNALFIDQSGDFKLEANLEYRSKIYSIFKGAFFLDAGNVWLLNDDPGRPGGEFKSENLYKEIGIGTGAGLRLDFTYFVMRFDWAFPLKKPFIIKSNGWVLDEIDFGSKQWRQDNLVLNVAIGYSF